MPSSSAADPRSCACSRRRSSSRRASALVAHALVGRQVDELAVQAVARGQPLVLVEHLPRVVAELLALVEVLGQLLDHRLDQRGEAERVLDARLRVAGADLDGAELRVRADVVPEVGVVLHHAAGDHELDLALVVGPVAVARRDAHARERAEDRQCASTARPGRVAAPERRVGAAARAGRAGGRASRWRRGSPCRGRRGRRGRAGRRSAPGARRSAAR